MTRNKRLAALIRSCKQIEKVVLFFASREFVPSLVGEKKPGTSRHTRGGQRDRPVTSAFSACFASGSMIDNRPVWRRTIP
jgi:hypothetical protein